MLLKINKIHNIIILNKIKLLMTLLSNICCVFIADIYKLCKNIYQWK